MIPKKKCEPEKKVISPFKKMNNLKDENPEIIEKIGDDRSSFIVSSRLRWGLEYQPCCLLQRGQCSRRCRDDRSVHVARHCP